MRFGVVAHFAGETTAESSRQAAEGRAQRPTRFPPILMRLPRPSVASFPGFVLTAQIGCAPVFQLIQNGGEGFSVVIEEILHAWRNFGVDIAGNDSVRLQLPQLQGKCLSSDAGKRRLQFRKTFPAIFDFDRGRSPLERVEGLRGSTLFPKDE